MNEILKNNRMLIPSWLSTDNLSKIQKSEVIENDEVMKIIIETSKACKIKDTFISFKSSYEKIFINIDKIIELNIRNEDMERNFDALLNHKDDTHTIFDIHALLVPALSIYSGTIDNYLETPQLHQASKNYVESYMKIFLEQENVSF